MMTAASGILQMYKQRKQGVAEITAAHQTARFIPAMLDNVKRSTANDFMIVFARTGCPRLRRDLRYISLIIVPFLGDRSISWSWIKSMKRRETV